jgi:hypothetical protein
MSRILGSILSGVVLLGAPHPAQAQSTLFEPYAMEDPGYGDAPVGYDGNGGFGLGYSQPVTAGAFVLDRFGLVHAAPRVGTPGVASAPCAPAPLRRTGRERGRATARYRLPTGSLYWPDAEGVMLYSGAARIRSYGDGYGIGPYGTTDHGIMYKGWSLQY